MTGNALSRALRRLTPSRRTAASAWSVGPGPVPGPATGSGIERFLLLAGGPARLLIDDALVTVGDGALLRLGPGELRRLIVLEGGREAVWLSLGPERDDLGGPR